MIGLAVERARVVCALVVVTGVVCMFASDVVVGLGEFLVVAESWVVAGAEGS